MGTDISVAILGFMIPIIIAIIIIMNMKKESADIPVYKVPIDQMIAVINMLLMEVRLTPYEKITLNQLIELLESWKEEELDEEE